MGDLPFQIKYVEEEVKYSKKLRKRDVNIQVEMFDQSKLLSYFESDQDIAAEGTNSSLRDTNQQNTQASQKNQQKVPPPSEN